MDSVFEAYLGHDGAGALLIEPDDIPKINTNVWILGKSYNAINELEVIRSDIRSKLWFSYRRGFIPLGEALITTDKGWGCMLRCGQMVLAQAMVDLHLGRSWFWSPETRDSTYLKIIKRFEDSKQSYFSIHQIALMGQSESKKVGEWFGPNTVAQVIKKLVGYDDFCSISVHVALDNIIVTDDIDNLFKDPKKPDQTWKPLLLIIPLRLGLNEINPIYINSIKKCFELEESLGIIGGRPNQALYFIGYVDDEVIFLDPHTIQNAGTVGDKTTQKEIDFDKTYHQKYAQRMKFTQMDPSLALCFLCKTRNNLEILLEKLQMTVTNEGNQALFEVVKKRSMPWISAADTTNSSSNDNISSSFFDGSTNKTHHTENYNADSEDDFEIIL